MIDDSDITWVNGKQVGSMIQQYNKHRNYSLPPGTLQAGKNEIVFRVEDTGGGGGQYGAAENLTLQVGDSHKSLAGMWKFRVGEARLQSGGAPNHTPTLLYKGMISPILPFPISGVIWYQGESNAAEAYEYRDLFPAMIRDWREQWGQGDFPFLWVQLANFLAAQKQPGESTWAELREAQSMALSEPATAEAVIIDIGEAEDIHPRNKKDVGLRLAAAALNMTYGKTLTYSGPRYVSMKEAGDRIRLTFDHTGSGMVARDKYGYLKGFAIAGNDKKFVWAQARIEGNEVIVWNPDVKNPVAVRYGWADNPDDANLYNQEGFPASPFRTDDWPGITQK